MAWRSIATETLRLIVGAILRLTITSAAKRFAANSMRSSAITKESGTIVVGGGAIAIGSSLLAAVGITGMQAIGSRHGVMTRMLIMHMTAQSTPTMDWPLTR